LRVFVDEHQQCGNPLGVVEDFEGALNTEDRQSLAAELGYSETVFVNDPDRSEIRIFGKLHEVPFAGHAAVGAAWFLRVLTGRAPTVLRTACGDVSTWEESGATWVRSALATTPPWWHERLSSVAELEAIDGPLSESQDMTQLWAWQDEQAGIMRVRTFASRAGIREDEACGSGAMRIAAAFGRSLTLRHGQGSVILARPGSPGFADIGGLVVEDASRTAGGRVTPVTRITQPAVSSENSPDHG
jgi:predicted PhzF superfamily epimerase YddE/YHI9